MTKRTLFVLLVGVASIAISGNVVAGPPLLEVRGHGIWALDRGSTYENHEPYIESTMVNVWLDDTGQARGTIEWMDVYNGWGLGVGPCNSGYTWHIAVDTITVLSHNSIYAEGLIVQSNCAADGTQGVVRTGFFIRDNGNTPADPPDQISWADPSGNFATAVLAGNFTIR